MKLQFYSHREGLRAIPKRIIQPIRKALEGLPSPKKFFSAPQLRKEVIEALTVAGWSNSAKVDASHGLTVTAMNDEVALCLQTGNMSRFYADLMKLQLLRQRGKASAAVFLIPTKDAAEGMGSNIANFDRFVEELKLFSDIITIPIYVVGIGI